MTRPPTTVLLLAALLVATAASALFISGVGAEETPQQDDEPTQQQDDEVFDDRPIVDGITVLYRGVLQNADGDPVSGVFELSFNLYHGSMSADPIWTENHYVSVVDGRYQVALGSDTALGAHLLAGERWLGVELQGEDELLRDQLTVDTPDGKPLEETDAGESVSHADIADRAAEAERARVAETAESVGDMTAEEIREQTEQALRRLGEHVSDPDAHSAAAGSSIGSTRRSAGDEAGGTGGTSYEITCPEGYVATGIRGGAGRVVDSITVLCSPLE